VTPIRWSQAAQRDYRDAIEWLSDRNPVAADRLADANQRRRANCRKYRGWAKWAVSKERASS
jgi:plasmid stabilization system protein ParE